MPTPSTPGPQPQSPYTFGSTCPDTDQLPPPRNDTDMDVTRDSEEYRGTPEDDATSTSTTTFPAPSFGNTDGPVHDVDDIPSPARAGDLEHLESHKHAETDDERTRSPCDLMSTDIENSRPRQGVGTGGLTNYNVDINTSSASEHVQGGCGTEEEYTMPSLGYGYPLKRTIPSSPSSFLRAGSRFTGTQQSERQVYDVNVEIKYVDLRESFLCGYLRIQGLTDDHPTLTTYFEGEIIGTKYGFMTKHESWGANDKTDLSHWSKFPAFRPYSKQARKGSSVVIKDIAQSEHIFMRWKEHFLVPDHRVRTIIGASFEGFYYICFNQIQGEVNGIYFHRKSERFQQLELKHVEDRGCFSALEFR